MKIALVLLMAAMPAFAETQKDCERYYDLAIRARLITGLSSGGKVVTGPGFNGSSFEVKKRIAHVIGCAVAGPGKLIPLTFVDYRTDKKVARLSNYGTFSVE